MQNIIERVGGLRGWKLLLLCILVLIVVRSLTLYSDVIQVDESDFATYGALWAEGGTPYVDFVDNKPPLCYGFYAVSNLLFGNNMLAVHIAMIIWIALTGWGLLCIARLIGYPRAGPWVALLYVSWTVCFPATATLPANSENMFNLPSVLAVYAYLRSRVGRSGSSASWILLAGFGVAIASLFKHQAGILLAVMGAHIVYETVRGRKAWWLVFRDGMILAIGFAIPWALFFAYFIWKGALDEALTYNFYFNLEYTDALFDYTRSFNRFVVRTGLFVLANFPLVICALYACRVAGGAKRMFFVLWLVGAMVAVSAGGHFSPHYYVQLWPPLVLLAALGWLRMLERFSLKWWTKALVILFVITPIIFTAVHWWSYFGRWFEPREPVIAELVHEVQTRTKPGERIFVWGYFSYPYYFGDRLPATRFVVCQYFVPYWEKKMAGATEFDKSEMTARHEKSYGQLLTDLRKYKPELIIDTTDSDDFTYWRPFGMDDFPEYQQFVLKNYHPVQNIRGMVIYERN